MRSLKTVLRNMLRGAATALDTWRASQRSSVESLQALIRDNPPKSNPDCELVMEVTLCCDKHGEYFDGDVRLQPDRCPQCVEMDDR